MQDHSVAETLVYMWEASKASGRYLPCMVSKTLSPCWRVPCSSSCFLLFLLLHNDEIKPGWDPSMLTLHLETTFLRQAKVGKCPTFTGYLLKSGMYHGRSHGMLDQRSTT